MAPISDPQHRVNPRMTGRVQRELEARRFSALASAIREHEVRAGAHLVTERPHDQALYRRLRQLSAQGS